MVNVQMGAKDNIYLFRVKPCGTKTIQPTPPLPIEQRPRTVLTVANTGVYKNRLTLVLQDKSLHGENQSAGLWTLKPRHQPVGLSRKNLWGAVRVEFGRIE
jgi:hypothetical protein